MIIKILSSTGTFAGVKYNTDKLKNDKGELMKVANMPLVDGLNISESECKQYFIAHSSVNKKVKNAQFHAVISADGKELDKYQLTEIAEKYLSKMGYGDNPYIVVFHNDTANNHVHIVSSRVDNNGKKIDHNMEGVRTNNIRLELMKEYSIQSKKDLDLLLSYSYQNHVQLTHLLKSRGYVVLDKGDDISIYYNGELKHSLHKNDLRKEDYNKQRLVQIKALMSKYSAVHSGELQPIYKKLKGDRLGDVVGYRSDLGDFLKSNFGLELYYHFSGNKKPYGYTVFDHSKKAIFKGSDIMKLSLIINEQKPSSLKKEQSFKNKLINKVNAYNINSLQHLQVLAKYYKIPEYQLSLNNNTLSVADKNFYKILLSHHFSNDAWSNLDKLNITPIANEGNLLLLDRSNLVIIDAKDYLEQDIIESYYNQGFDLEHKVANDDKLDLSFGWDITDDVDDEMVHGVKRKKRKRN